jgi:hypothetical protein
MNLRPPVVRFGVQHERAEDLDLRPVLRKPDRRVEVPARGNGIGLRHRPFADGFNDEGASWTVMFRLLSNLSNGGSTFT